MRVLKFQGHLLNSSIQAIWSLLASAVHLIIMLITRSLYLWQINCSNIFDLVISPYFCLLRGIFKYGMLLWLKSHVYCQLMWINNRVQLFKIVSIGTFVLFLSWRNMLQFIVLWNVYIEPFEWLKRKNLRHTYLLGFQVHWIFSWAFIWFYSPNFFMSIFGWWCIYFPF